MEKEPVSEVDFAELSDGSLVEMIEDPADATKTLLAVYCEKSVRYAERVEDRGRILVALSRVDQNLRHVRLAQGAEPYGQLSDLQNEVASLLQSCLDLEAKSLVLMTAFAMSTWFSERLSVAPYLALVGPPGSGKTTAMRVLNLLCYRSLLTTDISSSAFYDISHRVHSTILLDETLTAGRSREMMHLLKASSTPDAVSLRKGKARLAYGPKVFSWLELPNDAALNSRCVIAPMHKTSRTDLMSPNDPRILECAKKVRMHLLQFRFERFRNIGVPEIPRDVALSARPLDLYRALALPFQEDQDTCIKLANFIRQEGKFQWNLLSLAQASVLRVLYYCIHKRRQVPYLPVGKLTAIVNRDLAKRGEPHGLNERKLGGILTSLCFTKRTRMNTGYVVWLDHSDRVHIHESVLDHAVEDVRAYPIKDCKLCPQIGTPSPKSASAKSRKGKKVRSKTSKREHRERRERRTRGIPVGQLASKRVRSSQS